MPEPLTSVPFSLSPGPLLVGHAPGWGGRQVEGVWGSPRPHTQRCSSAPPTRSDFHAGEQQAPFLFRALNKIKGYFILG